MVGYIFSERAKQDIVEIGNYTESIWSEKQAEIYLRALFQECENLSKNPLIGRSYDEYRKGLRGFPCGKHIIFYRILSKNRIRIVRVLHERMDVSRRI